MTWGVVELEPEVEKWLESLPTALFARAAFYVDLLGDQGRCSASRTPNSSIASYANCGFISNGRQSGSLTGSRGPADHPVDRLS
jgi:hypothetical protein